MKQKEEMPELRRKPLEIGFLALRSARLESERRRAETTDRALKTICARWALGRESLGVPLSSIGRIVRQTLRLFGQDTARIGSGEILSKKDEPQVETCLEFGSRQKNESHMSG